MEQKEEIEDIRDLINNQAEYFQADVVDGKFTMRSTEAEDWLNRKKCVIVIDNITGKSMLLTPFDLVQDGVSDNKFKRSYHEGRFATLTFEFFPDQPYLPDTEISKWSKALLKRWHYSFFNRMKDYLISDEFRTLNNLANNVERKTKTIFPVKENVYRMFSFRADTLRVCILGLDPYPNTHANGISFATDQLVKPVSLRQLEKAIQKDLNYEIDWQIQNNLLNVVKQGVFFLNSALTVEANKSGSYSDLWEPFTRKAIKAISDLPNPVIFILMGKVAQSFESSIDSKKNTIFKVEHPAAANYVNREWNYDSIFAKTNEILTDMNTPPIKW